MGRTTAQSRTGTASKERNQKEPGRTGKEVTAANKRRGATRQAIRARCRPCQIQEVDNAIAVVDGKARTFFNAINAINTNLTDNYQTNAQLTSNYYNKTEIDANNWIDNTQP